MAVEPAFARMTREASIFYSLHKIGSYSAFEMGWAARRVPIVGSDPAVQLQVDALVSKVFGSRLVNEHLTMHVINIFAHPAKGLKINKK